MFGPTLRSCSCRGHAQYPTFAPGSSQVALVVKNPPGNAGDIRDVGLIPGSERSPGGGHGNPLQYLCLENAWTEELGGLQAIALQRVGLKQFSTQAREIILDNLGGPDWISW